MLRSGANTSGRWTMTMLLAIGALAVLAGVAVTVYPVELGLARADESSKRAVEVVAEIDATLAGGDYREFSEALAVGHAAVRVLPVRNAAETALDRALGNALDCYDAAGESWQAELEGEWAPGVHGDPRYWHSFHPAVRLGQPDVGDPANLRSALASQARGYLDEAFAIVGRAAR